MNILSNNWWKKENTGKIALTVTATGGAATAFLYDNMIVVDFTNTATTASYVVTTPMGFTVVDAHTHANVAATGAVIYVDNGATHITSDVGGATDALITRTTSILDSTATFLKGDNDLTISASATATAAPAQSTVIINIKPT
jgi:hypothetical protein